MTRELQARKLGPHRWQTCLFSLLGGGSMGSRRKGKRRDMEPVWVAHLPGYPGGRVLEAGDLPGPQLSGVRANQPAHVYVFTDDDEAVLYVGSTAHAEQRLHDHRSQVWWPEVAHVLWEEHPSLVEARLREAELIERLNPRYNIVRPVFAPREGRPVMGLQRLA